jgi:uncharacterized protein (DUF58 family)
MLAALRRSLANRAARWARKRQGDDHPPFALHARRLYILPTRAGAGFGALLFLMLLAGLNYANALALFLTFLLGGFAIVAMHLTHRNLNGLRVVAIATSDGFAGESGRVIVTVANGADAARPLLLARIATRQEARIDLPAGAVRRFELALPLPARGWIPVGRIRIATRYPFGLFEAWTWLHTGVAAVAYPAPRGTLEPPATARHGGQASALHQAGDDELSALRPFRDGDSPRQVAWRAYARGGDLLVKEYESPAGEFFVFDLAQVAHLDTEAALQQIAQWTVAAHARGERFGLRLGGDFVPAAAGLEHRDRCLRALALYGQPIARGGEPDV